MIRKILSVFLVVFWSCFIFGFSASDGKESGSLSEEVLTTVFNVITPYPDDSEKIEDLVDKYHFPFRKFAHFTVYFILGFLVMNALLSLGITRRAVIIAVIICVLSAIFDEVHQLFVDGRHGSVADALLDSSGSCLSIYLFSRLILLRGKNEKASFQ